MDQLEQRVVLNADPIAVDDDYLTAPGQAVDISTQTLLANDTDGDYDVLMPTAHSFQTAQGVSVAFDAQGVFHYQAPTGFVGTDTFRYWVDDGQAMSNAATVRIRVNGAPTGNGEDIGNVYQGSSASGNVLGNDTDPENDLLSMDPVATAVSGGYLTIDQDGNYSFTADFGTTGPGSYDYTFRDAAGNTASATLAWNVLPSANPNYGPTGHDDDVGTVLPSSPVSGNLFTNDTDPENDALSMDPVSMAIPGGYLTIDQYGNYNISADGTLSSPGSYLYSFRDSTGNTASAMLSWNLFVPETPNGAPTAYDDESTITLPAGENTAVFEASTYLPNLGNDTDPENDPLTVVSSVPTGWQYVQVDGTWSYQYTISDPFGNTSTASVIVHVVGTPAPPPPPNYSPTGNNDDVGTVYQGNSATGNVLANDADPENDSLSMDAVNTPVTGGYLTIDQYGNYVFTADAGTTGPGSYEYTFRDSYGNTASGTLSWNVEQQNQYPTAGDDSFSTEEDHALVIPFGSLTANDCDPEGAPLSFGGLAVPPTYGTVVVNSDGTLTYTPATDFGGTDTFTYVIFDNIGQTATAQVTITMNPVNDEPTLLLPETQQTVVMGGALTFSVAGGNALVVGDAEEGVQQLTLAVDHGLLASGAASPAATLVLSGTVAELNAALDGLQFLAPSDYAGPAQLTATLDDQDAGGALTVAATVALRIQPAISIADASASEAAGMLMFTVTLSAPSDQDVTVFWQTQPGTADAADFTAASDTLTIAAGQTTGVISVALTNDERDEDDQTFHIILSAPSGAQLADDAAQGTILDDDAAPTVRVVSTTVAETIGTATVHVVLTGASEKPITVEWHPADGSATRPADWTQGTYQESWDEPPSWVDTSNYGDVWVDTSHYGDVWHADLQNHPVWVDTSYEETVWQPNLVNHPNWIDTSHWGNVWHANWQDVWVDTSHYENVWQPNLVNHPVWIDPQYDGEGNLIAEGYSEDHWVDEGSYASSWVTEGHYDSVDQGGWSWDWITEGHSEDNWVDEGSFVPHWVADGHFEDHWVDDGGNVWEWITAGHTETQWITDGYWNTVHHDAYWADGGTLTFNPGETDKTIAIDVVNDALEEGDEALSISLSNAHNATLDGSSSGTVTIADDDSIHTISAQATALVGVTGQTLGGTLANFTVANPGALTAANLTALVQWGDGQVGEATIVADGGGFQVVGSHQYVQEGPYVFVIQIRDALHNSVGFAAGLGWAFDGTQRETLNSDLSEVASGSGTFALSEINLNPTDGTFSLSAQGSMNFEFTSSSAGVHGAGADGRLLSVVQQGNISSIQLQATGHFDAGNPAAFVVATTNLDGQGSVAVTRTESYQDALLGLITVESLNESLHEIKSSQLLGGDQTYTRSESVALTGTVSGSGVQLLGSTSPADLVVGETTELLRSLSLQGVAGSFTLAGGETGSSTLTESGDYSTGVSHRARHSELQSTLSASGVNQTDSFSQQITETQVQDLVEDRSGTTYAAGGTTAEHVAFARSETNQSLQVARADTLDLTTTASKSGDDATGAYTLTQAAQFSREFNETTDNQGRHVELSETESDTLSADGSGNALSGAWNLAQTDSLSQTIAEAETNQTLAVNMTSSSTGASTTNRSGNTLTGAHTADGHSESDTIAHSVSTNQGQTVTVDETDHSEVDVIENGNDILGTSTVDETTAGTTIVDETETNQTLSVTLHETVASSGTFHAVSNALTGESGGTGHSESDAIVHSVSVNQGQTMIMDETDHSVIDATESGNNMLGTSTVDETTLSSSTVDETEVNQTLSVTLHETGTSEGTVHSTSNALTGVQFATSHSESSTVVHSESLNQGQAVIVDEAIHSKADVIESGNDILGTSTVDETTEGTTIVDETETNQTLSVTRHETITSTGTVHAESNALTGVSGGTSHSESDVIAHSTSVNQGQTVTIDETDHSEVDVVESGNDILGTAVIDETTGGSSTVDETEINQTLSVTLHETVTSSGTVHSASNALTGVQSATSHNVSDAIVHSESLNQGRTVVADETDHSVIDVTENGNDILGTSTVDETAGGNSTIDETETNQTLSVTLHKTTTSGGTVHSVSDALTGAQSATSRNVSDTAVHSTSTNQGQVVTVDETDHSVIDVIESGNNILGTSTVDETTSGTSTVDETETNQTLTVTLHETVTSEVTIHSMSNALSGISSGTSHSENDVTAHSVSANQGQMVTVDETDHSEVDVTESGNDILGTAVIDETTGSHSVVDEVEDNQTLHVTLHETVDSSGTVHAESNALTGVSSGTSHSESDVTAHSVSVNQGQTVTVDETDHSEVDVIESGNDILGTSTVDETTEGSTIVDETETNQTLTVTLHEAITSTGTVHAESNALTGVSSGTSHSASDVIAHSTSVNQGQTVTIDETDHSEVDVVESGNDILGTAVIDETTGGHSVVDEVEDNQTLHVVAHETVTSSGIVHAESNALTGMSGSTNHSESDTVIHSESSNQGQIVTVDETVHSVADVIESGNDILGTAVIDETTASSTTVDETEVNQTLHVALHETVDSSGTVHAVSNALTGVRSAVSHNLSDADTHSVSIDQSQVVTIDETDHSVADVTESGNDILGTSTIDETTGGHSVVDEIEGNQTLHVTLHETVDSSGTVHGESNALTGVSSSTSDSTATTVLHQTRTNQTLTVTAEQTDVVTVQATQAGNDVTGDYSGSDTVTTQSDRTETIDNQLLVIDGSKSYHEVVTSTSLSNSITGAFSSSDVSDKDFTNIESTTNRTLTTDTTETGVEHRESNSSGNSIAGNFTADDDATTTTTLDRTESNQTLTVAVHETSTDHVVSGESGNSVTGAVTTDTNATTISDRTETDVNQPVIAGAAHPDDYKLTASLTEHATSTTVSNNASNSITGVFSGTSHSDTTTGVTETDVQGPSTATIGTTSSHHSDVVSSGNQITGVESSTADGHGSATVTKHRVNGPEIVDDVTRSTSTDHTESTGNSVNGDGTESASTTDHTTQTGTVTNGLYLASATTVADTTVDSDATTHSVTGETSETETVESHVTVDETDADGGTVTVIHHVTARTSDVTATRNTITGAYTSTDDWTGSDTLAKTTSNDFLPDVTTAVTQSESSLGLDVRAGNDITGLYTSTNDDVTTVTNSTVETQVASVTTTGFGESVSTVGSGSGNSVTGDYASGQTITTTKTGTASISAGPRLIPSSSESSFTTSHVGSAGNSVAQTSTSTTTSDSTQNTTRTVLMGETQQQSFHVTIHDVAHQTTDGLHGDYVSSDSGTKTSHETVAFPGATEPHTLVVDETTTYGSGRVGNELTGDYTTYDSGDSNSTLVETSSSETSDTSQTTTSNHLLREQTHVTTSGTGAGNDYAGVYSRTTDVTTVVTTFQEDQAETEGEMNPAGAEHHEWSSQSHTVVNASETDTSHSTESGNHFTGDSTSDEHRHQVSTISETRNFTSDFEDNDGNGGTADGSTETTETRQLQADDVRDTHRAGNSLTGDYTTTVANGHETYTFSWNSDSESNADASQQFTYFKYVGAHTDPTEETGKIEDTTHSTHHSDLTETGARNYAGNEGSGNQVTGSYSTNIAGADAYQIIAHDESHTETEHTSPDTAEEVWGDHQEWIEDYYDWRWHPNLVNYPYQMDDYDDYGNVVGSHSEDNWIDEGDWSWDLIEEGYWTTVPDEDPHWEEVDGADIEAESESDATLTLSGTEQFAETTSGDSFDDFGNSTQNNNHTYSLLVTTHTRSDDGQGHVDEDNDSRNETKSDESSRYGLLGDVHFAGLGTNGVVGAQAVGAPLQLHHPAEPKGGELAGGHAAGGGLAEGIGDFASGQAASGAAGMESYAGQNLDLLHQYCFARETLVLTKRGMLPIVDVQPNDEVRAVPDHSPHSAADWHRVERVYRNEPAALLNVHVEGLAQPIRATRNHPWYVAGRGWTSTAELQVGESLLTSDGRTTRVVELFDNGDCEPVFNLCVAVAHTYFVGDTDCAVLVHNQSAEDAPEATKRSWTVDQLTSEVDVAGHWLGRVQQDFNRLGEMYKSGASEAELDQQLSNLERNWGIFQEKRAVANQMATGVKKHVWLPETWLQGYGDVLTRESQLPMGHTDIETALGQTRMSDVLRKSGVRYGEVSRESLQDYEDTIFVLETGKQLGETADKALLVHGLVNSIAKKGVMTCAAQLAKEHAKDYVASEVVNTLLDVANVPQDVRDAASQAVGAVRAIRAIRRAQTTSCFPAGTPVSIGDGFKPIEEVRPGDACWSFNLATGFWEQHEVVESYKFDYVGEAVTIRLDDGGSVESTYHHPFWVSQGDELPLRPKPEHVVSAEPPQSVVEGRWVDAGDLRTGDELLLMPNRRVKIVGVEFRQISECVYNFQVAGLHNYAVGTGRILVHNNCGDDTYSRPSGYRKGVRDQAWNQAIEPSTGRVRDPETGRFMSPDAPWDMGHKPGYEFRKHQQSAVERSIDRDQFLDEHNDPSHYRPELPASNRSHSGEDMTSTYFGP